MDKKYDVLLELDSNIISNESSYCCAIKGIKHFETWFNWKIINYIVVIIFPLCIKLCHATPLLIVFLEQHDSSVLYLTSRSRALPCVVGDIICTLIQISKYLFCFMAIVHYLLSRKHFVYFVNKLYTCSLKKNVLIEDHVCVLLHHN